MPSRFKSAVDNTLGLAANGDTQYEDAKKTNIKEASKDRVFQFMTNELAYQRSTPAHQMELYREAGLNPSLMYGQMSDLATEPLAGAEANAPSPSSGRLDQLLGLGADIAMKVPTIAADVDLKRAQAAEIRSRIPVNNARTLQLLKSLDSMQADIEMKRSNIIRNGVLNRLTEQQTQDIVFKQGIASASLDQAERRLQNDIGWTQQQIKESNAKIKKILADANVSKEQYHQMIEFFAYKKALTQSEIEKNTAQSRLFVAQQDQALATRDKLVKEGLRLEQVMNLDLPNEDRATTMFQMANSKNPLDRVCGQIMYAIDYASGDILGAFLK